MSIDDLIVDVYEVYNVERDSDTHKDLVGVFSTYELAYNAAKGRGLFGTYGLIKGAKGIILGETVYVLKYSSKTINHNISEAKEKEVDDILKKLTSEELEKLNIDRDKLLKEKSDVEFPSHPFNIPA